MIIGRSIYRLGEFASLKFSATAVTGYTQTHEWLLYAFDAIPITIAVFTLLFVHPGRFLPHIVGERIDGGYEEQGPQRWCGCCCIRNSKRTRPYVRQLEEHGMQRMDDALPLRH